MPKACPLGLNRCERDCPRAPCLECMRRLGEHMIEDMHSLHREHPEAWAMLNSLVDDLGMTPTGDPA